MLSLLPQQAIFMILSLICGQGRNPCVIPVGGSNALGTWGYLEAAREMDAQLREAGITDVTLVRCQAAHSHDLVKLAGECRAKGTVCCKRSTPHWLCPGPELSHWLCPVLSRVIKCRRMAKIV